MSVNATASAVLSQVFHTDLLKSIEQSQSGTEVVVKQKGKVSTLSTKKILKGDRAEYQKLAAMQDNATISIINAASILAGQKTIEGGDAALTNKIVTTFKKFQTSSRINEKDFAKDLFKYASQLQDVQCKRRWHLDMQTGIEDLQAQSSIIRILAKEGLNYEGWASQIQSNFHTLKGANSTIQDIHRYGQQNRYHLFLGDGKEATLPKYQGKNISSYLDNLLDSLMTGLKMVKTGEEHALSDHSAKIKAQLQSYIREEINKADKLSQEPARKARGPSQIPQEEVDGAKEDQVRDALLNLMKDLNDGKFGSDEKEKLLDKKLGFLLFGMNQNWIVGPGIQFGRIAKVCSVPGRYSETMLSSAAKLDDKTTIHLYIDPDGNVKIKAIGVHTNVDHVKGSAPKDYTATIATTVEFRPNEPHQVSFSVGIEIPEKDRLPREKGLKIQNPETKALVELLAGLGFKPELI